MRILLNKTQRISKNKKNINSPVQAATIKGVTPSSLVLFISAPFLMSSFANSSRSINKKWFEMNESTGSASDFDYLLRYYCMAVYEYCLLIVAFFEKVLFQIQNWLITQNFSFCADTNLYTTFESWIFWLCVDEINLEFIQISTYEDKDWPRIKELNRANPQRWHSLQRRLAFHRSLLKLSRHIFIWLVTLSFEKNYFREVRIKHYQINTKGSSNE